MARPDATEYGTAVSRLTIAGMLLRAGAPVPQPAGAIPQFLIPVADAESAAVQLRQISEPSVLDDELPGVLASQWGLATLVLLQGGQPAGDVSQVIGELDRSARVVSPEAEVHPELLALRAILLAVPVLTPDSPDGGLPQASESVLAAVLSLPPEHPLRPPLLQMLMTVLRRQATAGISSGDMPAELERVLQILERVPADTPELTEMLVFTCTELLHALFADRAAVPTDRVAALLKASIGNLAPDSLGRYLAEAMYAGTIGLRGAAEHRPAELEEAAGILQRLWAEIPAGHAARPLILAGLPSVLIEQYNLTGELRHLTAAEKYTKMFLEAAESTPGWAGEGLGMGHYLSGVLGAARYLHGQDRASIRGVVRDFELAAELVPPSSQLYARVTAELGATRAMLDLQTTGFEAGVPPISPAARDGLNQAAAVAERVGAHHTDLPILTAQAAHGLVMQAMGDQDLGKLNQALTLFGRMHSMPNLALRERSRLLHLHGFALMLRYRTAGDPRDLNNAIDRLEEARRAVEQEDGNPFAGQVLEALADAYRCRADAGGGDAGRAVSLGLAALRENAGNVLLQNSDEDALGAARAGISDAITMARWSLGHARVDPAVSAIELGRGMVLHAATAGAGLSDALRHAGQEPLAAEWEHAQSRFGQGLTGAAADESADDLRSRIMRAIEGSDAHRQLLSAPSAADIRAALAAARADALVYLLPRDEDGPGMAVIIDATGPVSRTGLPGLWTGPRSPARSCEQARVAADGISERAAGYEAVQRRWRDELGKLCDWAWQSGIEPLLRVLPAAAGRPRRVVLVPVGELGLVPWHAARRPMGSGYQYACDEAVITYAGSARQFADAAHLPTRPWAERAVLISESRKSGSSQVATTAALRYIQAHYYPAAEVFGNAYQPPVSPGPAGGPVLSPRDVLSALPGEASPGASVLHFGCHGRARVPVLDSSLDLGDGGELAVKAILRQARARSRAEPGGLVVLAACLSDVTETDYDEALTLATAFLSAGSAGVVGARWAVHEDHAALFMVMLHHYLSGSPGDAAQALNRAQLWMLDPGREPLPGLPKVLLEEVSEPELADPAAWAAYAYRGR